MINVDPTNPRGIVWIASFPRSGSTWSRIVLNRLFALNTGGPQEFDVNQPSTIEAGEADVIRFDHLLGKPAKTATRAEIAAIRPLVHKQILDSYRGLVLVKTHNAHRHYLGAPLVTQELTAGAIYLVRNPLDVAISFAAFCNETIDDTIRIIGSPGLGSATDEKQVYWQTGSWSENVTSWTEPPDQSVLVVRYEDMMTQPIETFTTMARHIGFSTKMIQQAIDDTSFQRLRKAEQDKGFHERPEGTTSFFREGRLDQWRSTLTEAQIKAVVANHHREMRRFGYLTDDLVPLVPA